MTTTIPTTPQVNAEQRGRAISTFAGGDPAGALKPLYELLMGAPKDPELLSYYGLALEAVGRHADAIKILSRVDPQQSSPAVREALAGAERAAAAPSAGAGPQSAGPTASEARATALAVGPPAGGAAQGAAPSSRVLADDLDTPVSELSPAAMRGAPCLVWHRRVTSYYRFWLGPALAGAALAVDAAGVPAHVAGDYAATLKAIHVGLGVLIALGALMLVSGVLAARMTSYSLYERRIDIKRGILSQRVEPIWLYDISSIELRRPALQTLTGTASIHLAYDQTGGAGKSTIAAPRSTRRVMTFMEQLQRDVTRERRAMKKMWI